MTAATLPSSEDALAIPASAATLGGFRCWALSDDFPQRGRITFCQGELLVDMSPQSLETHSKVKVELNRVLANLLLESDIGTLYDDRTLVTNEEADLSTEPDATLVTHAAQETGRVKRTRRRDGRDYVEIQGTPDLVVEIVSPSSATKDTRRLRGAYFDAGIPEYWLIDANGPKIKFEILVHQPRGYRAARAAQGWITSPVLGRAFRWKREHNRLGDWRYTLEVR